MNGRPRPGSEHFHTLALGGVFAEDDTGKLALHPLPGLTNGDVADLLQIARVRTQLLPSKRVGRALTDACRGLTPRADKASQDDDAESSPRPERPRPVGRTGQALLPLVLLLSAGCVRVPAGNAPTTAAALRQASEQAASGQPAEVVASDARRIPADAGTMVISQPLDPRDPVPEQHFALRRLYLKCHTTNLRCPLDQPDRQWSVQRTHLVPDHDAINLAVGLAEIAGVVAFQGGCFASWCGPTGKKVLIGVDVAAVAGGVVLGAIWVDWARGMSH